MSGASESDAQWFDRLGDDPHRALAPEELDRFFREAKRRSAVPNLARISGDRDQAAISLLGDLPEVIDGERLESLDEESLQALGRFGARSPSLALRSADPGLLRSGLLAAAITAAVTSRDDRDVMVGLATHVDAAQRLGVPVGPTFDAVALLLGSNHIADLLRTFGARRDVTLAAFKWEMVELPDGPDYVPVW